MSRSLRAFHCYKHISLVVSTKEMEIFHLLFILLKPGRGQGACSRWKWHWWNLMAMSSAAVSAFIQTWTITSPSQVAPPLEPLDWRSVSDTDPETLEVHSMCSTCSSWHHAQQLQTMYSVRHCLVSLAKHCRRQFSRRKPPSPLTHQKPGIHSEIWKTEQCLLLSSQLSVSFSMPSNCLLPLVLLVSHAAPARDSGGRSWWPGVVTSNCHHIQALKRDCVMSGYKL